MATWLLVVMWIFLMLSGIILHDMRQSSCLRSHYSASCPDGRQRTSFTFWNRWIDDDVNWIFLFGSALAAFYTRNFAERVPDIKAPSLQVNFSFTSLKIFYNFVGWHDLHLYSLIPTSKRAVAKLCADFITCQSLSIRA